jgi:hypothetical protein
MKLPLITTAQLASAKIPRRWPKLRTMIEVVRMAAEKASPQG